MATTPCGSPRPKLYLGVSPLPPAPRAHRHSSCAMGPPAEAGGYGSRAGFAGNRGFVPNAGWWIFRGTGGSAPNARRWISRDRTAGEASKPVKTPCPAGEAGPRPVAPGFSRGSEEHGQPNVEPAKRATEEDQEPASGDRDSRTFRDSVRVCSAARSAGSWLFARASGRRLKPGATDLGRLPQRRRGRSFRRSRLGPVVEHPDIGFREMRIAEQRASVVRGVNVPDLQSSSKKTGWRDGS